MLVAECLAVYADLQGTRVQVDGGMDQRPPLSPNLVNMTKNSVSSTLLRTVLELAWAGLPKYPGAIPWLARWKCQSSHEYPEAIVQLYPIAGIAPGLRLQYMT